MSNPNENQNTENETINGAATSATDTTVVEKKKTGFLAMPNDSIAKTFIVAFALCLVCSVIVAFSATILKPTQQKNRLIDLQKNILSVAGLTDESQTIEERFEKIEARLIDMETGEYSDAIDVASYNQRKAAKDPSLSIDLTTAEDIASIGRRAKYGKVYTMKTDGELTKVIIPIKGYGLWSTMYGFIALKPDGRTIEDVTFYEHNETPGLGGEIQNSAWQEVWKGKSVTDDQGKPAFTVVKGRAAADSKYDVDGLAGATLTSVGVMNLVRFWVGENGFGPYLKKLAVTAGANNG